MYTEIKAFSFIDDFLRHLESSNDATVYELGDTFYSKESQIAYKILCDKIS